MLPFVLLWLTPHLYVVARCRDCRRADVHTRWPETFGFCERCGACASARELQADAGDVEPDRIN